MGDYRTPAIASIVLLFVSVALNLSYVLGLGMGTEGLTLAASVVALLNAAWLRARLKMLLPIGRAGRPLLARIGLATIGMVLAVWGVRALVHAQTRLGAACLYLLLPIMVGMLVYVALHVASGGRELADLWRRRRARRTP